MNLLPFFVCLFGVGVLVVEAKLEEKFHWKQLVFDWPTAQAEKDALKAGDYIVENNLPLGVEKWNNKLFITVPR